MSHDDALACASAFLGLVAAMMLLVKAISWRRIASLKARLSSLPTCKHGLVGVERKSCEACLAEIEAFFKKDPYAEAAAPCSGIPLCESCAAVKSIRENQGNVRFGPGTAETQPFKAYLFPDGCLPPPEIQFEEPPLPINPLCRQCKEKGSLCWYCRGARGLSRYGDITVKTKRNI